MSERKKLVSIIVNCFNGEKYLYEALNSVVTQTYKNWELIFFDNQSKDKSKKIFCSFKNKKFKYYRSKKHLNLYAARNEAIKKCKGEFLSFIDTDDIWERHKLEKQIKLFRDKNVGVVYGNLWIKKEPVDKKRTFIRYNLPEGYIFENLIKNYYVGIITSVIRKKILYQNNIFFKNYYNIIGDFDLFIRLSKKFKFKAVQEPVATYRLHNDNLSKTNKNSEAAELKKWLKKNNRFLKDKEKFFITKKIKNLEFQDLLKNKKFLYMFRFFIINKSYLFNFKNIIILLLPTYILKKIIWFMK